MNRLDTSFRYPTNEDGLPEFASVIVTLDHLSAGREGNPHVNQKVVFSTQDEVEALYALFGYYEQMSLATQPLVAKIVGELFTKDYPVFVYSTGKNVEIVLARDSFVELVAHQSFGKGSVLLAICALQEEVQKMAQAITAQDAPCPPLFGFELEFGDYPADGEAVPSSLDDQD